jgi:putative DNA primase/helicase
MTFNAISPNEPTDQQAEVDTLFKWLEAKRNRQRNTRTTTVGYTLESRMSANNSFLDAQAIIDKASKSKGGEVFLSLYNGDWQALNIGDGTQSSADLALANKLAFWCGCDVALMTEIFRQSGLYRNERKTRLAINRAVQDCGTVYGMR